MHRFILIALVAFSAFAQEPRQIIERAMAKDEQNLNLRDNYLCERRTRQVTYEKDGRIKEDISKTHEVFYYDGTEIERLIAKNGVPLADKELLKEQQRVDKEIEKIRKENPRERAKRRGESEKDKREEIEARRELLEAFDFSMVGTKDINGRPCWGIRGEPRPGFNGKGRRADQMKKVRGVVWIDQGTYEFTRMELDTHDTISFGWFLFRLQPGAKIHVEQSLINNEVWLPRAVDIRADARLLGKMMRIGIEMRYDKFRKFSSDSKLVTEGQ